MRAADDDAPFSESMLEWLDEGDRMADAPPGVMRPSGAHRALEAPKRRERYFVVGGIVVALALVLTLHFVGGKKATAEAGETAPEPAKPSAFAPVADPSAAPAPAPPAPVAAVPVAAAVVAPAQAAAAVAAPAAAVVPPEPVAAPQAAVAPAAALVPAEAPQVAAAPAPVVPAAAARPTVAAIAPLAGSDAYDAVIGECRAHVAAGRISHALTSCKAALDARPQAPEALTLMAETEFTRGHAGVALKLATSAAEANQNYADAYVIMGGVYQEKGKNAEARAAYEQYLALQPKGKHASDLRAILSSMP